MQAVGTSHCTLSESKSPGPKLSDRGDGGGRAARGGEGREGITKVRDG